MIKKTKKEKTWPIYICYTEHKSGGNPLDDEDYPNYSDLHIDFRINSVHHRQNRKEDRLPSKREKYEINFNPMGKEIYIIVVRYDSGDTFSRSFGNWHIDSIYKSDESAVDRQEKIENDKVKGYVEWKGYFRKLEHVELCCVKVLP